MCSALERLAHNQTRRLGGERKIIRLIGCKQHSLIRSIAANHKGPDGGCGGGGVRGPRDAGHPRVHESAPCRMHRRKNVYKNAKWASIKVDVKSRVPGVTSKAGGSASPFVVRACAQCVRAACVVRWRGVGWPRAGIGRHTARAWPAPKSHASRRRATRACECARDVFDGLGGAELEPARNAIGQRPRGSRRRQTHAACECALDAFTQLEPRRRRAGRL